MAIYADKKDGKATGRWRVEVQLDGQRKRGRFDTHDAAKTAEREWELALASGEFTATATRYDPRVKPKTLSQLLTKASPMIWNGSAHGADCERKVAAIIQHMGDISLDRIATTTVDDIITWLRKEDKAAGTINRYLSALHAVLKWGARSGRNYVADLPEFEWEEEDEGRIRVVSSAEEAEINRLFLRMGQPKVAAFVTSAIDTGCRRGELLAALPDQVQGNWLRLWADQTKGKVARSVPLTPRAKALLEEFLPWTLPVHTLRHFWDRAREDMGLADDEDFVVHALRHTCCTRLVEAKVNLAVVQKYMGHKSIQTTLRYAHVSDDLLAEAALALAHSRGPLSSEGEGPKLNGGGPHLALAGAPTESAGDEA